MLRKRSMSQFVHSVRANLRSMSASVPNKNDVAKLESQRRCLPAESITVAACFVTHICTFGPIYTFGVFLPPLKETLNVSLGVAASVNSTMTALQFVGSLTAGFLIPKVASHTLVTIVGALAVLVGFGVMSIADSIGLIYAAVATAGFGLGACNLAGLTALNACVSPERRALFVGFASCGTSVATVAMPQLLTPLIEVAGWRWAIRINAFVSAFALLMTAPAYRVPAPKPLAAAQGSRAASSPNASTSVHPCRETRFLFWWLTMAFTFLGYFAPAILLAEYAEKKLHLSPEEAALAYSVMGMGALSTRVLLGVITKIMGSALRVFAASQTAVAIMTVILPWCAQNAVSTVAWSAAYGMCIGPLIAVISVVLSELFGAQNLPLYHGFSRAGVGLGTFCGPPLIGWLVEKAGYHAAFGVAGALVLFSQGFLALMWMIHRRRLLADESQSSERQDVAEEKGDSHAEAKLDRCMQAGSGTANT
eukprot:TRINITY_DN16547_c0_g1_i2.p1 TRINITY_DN16547_c0_g1~~TRINITY_DN16547_c0_g1_i2.p1  ORF type:complete len:479 (-),score=61.16 TRINITY_DN16547_c0_g1_i2:337-1773(-)